MNKELFEKCKKLAEEAGGTCVSTATLNSVGTVSYTHLTLPQNREV